VGLVWGALWLDRLLSLRGLRRHDVHSARVHRLWLLCVRHLYGRWPLPRVGTPNSVPLWGLWLPPAQPPASPSVSGPRLRARVTHLQGAFISRAWHFTPRSGFIRGVAAADLRRGVSGVARVAAAAAVTAAQLWLSLCCGLWWREHRIRCWCARHPGGVQGRGGQISHVRHNADSANCKAWAQAPASLRGVGPGSRWVRRGRSRVRW
jgi:hypothetical protein